MASETDNIERDIEKARTQLASTLDELATRASPSRLMATAQRTVTEKLADPKVQAAIAGVVVLVIAIVVVRRRR